MKRDLAALTEKEFDVLVIGGGITGACLAYDLTLRGLKTALVDQDDFGSRTSAASSKLLHGGIRYLQQGRLDKIYESAQERAFFQNLAPHLTRYVPFIIPTYRDSFMKSRTALAAGLAVYEAICRIPNGQIQVPGKSVPGSRSLSRAEVLREIPQLEGQKNLTGAKVLFESHMISSERMTLAFVRSAVHEGAVAANYVKVTGFLEEGGDIRGVRAEDRETGEAFDIRSRLVANAAGPWIPLLHQAAAGQRLKAPARGYAKGMHLVTRSIHSEYALALTTAQKNEALVNRGGRHLFFIPWRGKTLIGTTNTPYTADLEAVRPQTEEIDTFLEEINATLPGVDLARRDVAYAFAGLYPLVAGSIRPDTYQGTGDYQLIDHERMQGPRGVVTVLGAKFTTARRLAEMATDLILRKLKFPPRPCRTQQATLLYANLSDMENFRKNRLATYQGMFCTEVLDHLLTHYGMEMDLLIQSMGQDKRLMERLCPGLPILAGEAVHAVRAEMAIHLGDFVFRRTGLGTLGRPDTLTLQKSASLMGEVLGWDAQRLEREVASVLDAYRWQQGGS